ncbi:hypothetical protein XELAEV_18027245mg [Xenopus laevis]|uniref:Uncharacterized protein n=1 Tax=Xenopus laevis TaxID=8355 RepID=A0A974HJL5_XENLA|nr:hypothetical protein XELAEV_18027245mg [Xenopus laevis]
MRISDFEALEKVGRRNTSGSDVIHRRPGYTWRSRLRLFHPYRLLGSPGSLYANFNSNIKNFLRMWNRYAE